MKQALQKRLLAGVDSVFARVTAARWQERLESRLPR
jgi:hypothetical protein